MMNGYSLAKVQFFYSKLLYNSLELELLNSSV